MADNSPNSPLDICNLSLSELKVDPITSLDQEGSEVAALCKQHYDIERKALLRKHVWNFAKTEEALALLSTATSTSFSDVYLLPKTYIRLISVGDILVGTKLDRFDIRSIRISGVFKRCILYDNNGAATLDILYIRNVISVSEFDPLFTILLKFEVANSIAPSITLKPSIKQDIKDSLFKARRDAYSIDGQERRPVRVSNSNFVNARKNLLRITPTITTDFDD